MTTTNFTGKLVRLVAFDPEKDAEYLARWNQDSHFQQLASSGPAKLWTAKEMKEWLEKHADELYNFTIRTLDDDRVVGNIDLSGMNWVTRDSWVGIGIGAREDWGKGYGTDAMNLILQFAFESLNLNRVSLTVFEYNERAVASYRKAGFREEGRQRQWMQRGGERFDLIYMGVLREEWEAAQNFTTIQQTEPVSSD